MEPIRLLEGYVTIDLRSTGSSFHRRPPFTNVVHTETISYWSNLCLTLPPQQYPRVTGLCWRHMDGLQHCPVYRSRDGWNLEFFDSRLASAWTQSNLKTGTLIEALVFFCISTMAWPWAACQFILKLARKREIHRNSIRLQYLLDDVKTLWELLMTRKKIRAFKNKWGFGKRHHITSWKDSF